MKKYCISSLILILAVTLLFSFVVPLFLTLCSPKPSSNVENRPFHYVQEPYLLLEDALKQSERVAKERGLSLDEVKKLIEKHTQSWPLQIFPTYVDARALNQEFKDV
jgi:K+-transporting ATPase c subunit